MNHVFYAAAVGGILFLFALSINTDLSAALHLFGLTILIGLAASVFYEKTILRRAKTGKDQEHV